MSIQRTLVGAASIVLFLLTVAEAQGQGHSITRSREIIHNHEFSHITGMIVENQDGEKLGKIQDLILDLKAGQIKYGLVSSGGLFGVGSGLRAVPGVALSLDTAKAGTISMDVSKVRWAATPPFKKSRLARQGAPGDFQLASDAVGKNLVNREQENLGVVSDLIVDFAAQRQIFAIISRGRPLEKKETFAVSLRSLTLAGRNKFMIDANRAAFQQARPFDETAWQSPGTNVEILRCAQ